MRAYSWVKGFGLSAVLACSMGQGCGAPGAAPGGNGGNDAGGTVTGPPQTMLLTSSAFVSGGAIPIDNAFDGDNVSPPLTWTDVPEGTRSFVITLTDDDAPGFTHWVIYNIPAGTTSLPEGLPKTDTLSSPPGALQGENSAVGAGYTGPDPPPGELHTYRFIIYALNTTLNVGSGASLAAVQEAIQGHVLGQGELVGTYFRP